MRCRLVQTIIRKEEGRRRGEIRDSGGETVKIMGTQVYKAMANHRCVAGPRTLVYQQISDRPGLKSDINSILWALE